MQVVFLYFRLFYLSDMNKMQPTTFWRARTFTEKSLPTYFELLDLEIEAQAAIFNWTLYQIEEGSRNGGQKVLTLFLVAMKAKWRERIRPHN